jgi:hypothetical protein
VRFLYLADQAGIHFAILQSNCDSISAPGKSEQGRASSIKHKHRREPISLPVFYTSRGTAPNTPLAPRNIIFIGLVLRFPEICYWHYIPAS